MSTITIGSPKQIAWAEAIRADKTDELHRVTTNLVVKANDAGDAAVRAELYRQRDLVLAWIDTKADARWWIDNRKYSINWLAYHNIAEIKGLAPTDDQ